MGYSNEPNDLAREPGGKAHWQGCPYVGEEPTWMHNPRLVEYEQRVGSEFFVGTALERRRCYRPRGHTGGHFLGDARWARNERKPSAVRTDTG